MALGGRAFQRDAMRKQKALPVCELDALCTVISTPLPRVCIAAVELSSIPIKRESMSSIPRRALNAMSRSKRLNKCDSTRGHSYKLFINRCNKSVLSNFFINRTAPVWNFLPSDCFSRDSLFHFKKSIKKVDFSRFMLYD